MRSFGRRVFGTGGRSAAAAAALGAFVEAAAAFGTFFVVPSSCVAFFFDDGACLRNDWSLGQVAFRRVWPWADSVLGLQRALDRHPIVADLRTQLMSSF